MPELNLTMEVEMDKLIELLKSCDADSCDVSMSQGMRDHVTLVPETADDPEGYIPKARGIMALIKGSNHAYVSHVYLCESMFSVMGKRYELGTEEREELAQIVTLTLFALAAHFGPNNCYLGVIDTQANDGSKTSTLALHLFHPDLDYPDAEELVLSEHWKNAESLL